MKKILFVSTTVVLCVATLWLVLEDNDETLDSQAISVDQAEVGIGVEPQTKRVKVRNAILAQTPSRHDQLEFATSLRGTEIDGQLRVDENGDLVLDQAVRDFFDYFLSASDELGPEAAIGELQRYIDTYLEGQATQQAHSLLANYLRYKQFELKRQQQPLTGERLKDNDALALLKANFKELRAKRAQLFDAQESKALFSIEDVYQNYTLASLEVLADESLDDHARSLRLNELQSELPMELQSSQQSTVTQQESQDQIERLSVRHTDDSAYHQALKDQGLGQDKADELVSYRHGQQLFEQQYKKYTVAASKLDAADVAYKSSLEKLRSHFFQDPLHQTKARLLDLSVDDGS